MMQALIVMCITAGPLLLSMENAQTPLAYFHLNSITNESGKEITICKNIFYKDSCVAFLDDNLVLRPGETTCNENFQKFHFDAEMVTGLMFQPTAPDKRKKTAQDSTQQDKYCYKFNYVGSGRAEITDTIKIIRDDIRMIKIINGTGALLRISKNNQPNIKLPAGEAKEIEFFCKDPWNIDVTVPNADGDTRLMNIDLKKKIQDTNLNILIGHYIGDNGKSAYSIFPVES